MAKIYKAEIYITDIHDDFQSISDIVDYIENHKYAPYIRIIKEQSAEFEWEDDVIINKLSCTNEQYSEFFDSLLEDYHEQS